MKGKGALEKASYAPGMPYVVCQPWKIFEEVELGLGMKRMGERKQGNAVRPKVIKVVW